MKRLLWLVPVGISLHLGAVSCSGNPPPDPNDIASCLAELNGELGGATTCEAIVRAITTVVSRDGRCSKLLLHGLKCEGKDGG